MTLMLIAVTAAAAGTMTLFTRDELNMPQQLRRLLRLRRYDAARRCRWHERRDASLRRYADDLPRHAERAFDY